MAWTAITYRCGHSGREQMYGATRDRERRVAWVEQGLCPDCFAAERAALHAAENAAAAQAIAAQPAAWAELTGTTKQVEWANTIRVAKVGEMEAKLANAEAMLATAQRDTPELVNPDAVPALERYRAITDAARHIRSASWWIDHRNLGPSDLARVIQSALVSKLAEKSA